MSIIRQTEPNPDHAAAPVVGNVEPVQPGAMAPHRHARHQLMFATRGVIHVRTAHGEWLLPPSRAIWIGAGVEHGLLVKRAADTRVLYIDPAICSAPACPISDAAPCRVLDVSPLVRELILACSELPWDRADDAQLRLARVLLDQVQGLEQAPVDMPLPHDPRALKVVDILRAEPASRESLVSIAARVGASARTIERLFARETHLSFGAWRRRQRMLFAMERLAYGDSVTGVAFDAGYESASSFVAAFRAMFGTTPARYFKSH